MSFLFARLLFFQEAPSFQCFEEKFPDHPGESAFVFGSERLDDIFGFGGYSGGNDNLFLHASYYSHFG